MIPEWKSLLLILGLALIFVCVMIILAIVDPLQPWKTRHCQHLRTRCAHGDEINWIAKQYVFRFWKSDIIRRQVCRDCGRPLNRMAICTATGRDIHEWNGPWPPVGAVFD